MAMFNSVLVVCVGNLCRSPTGQYLLERGLGKVKVSSAGLLAKANQPACQTAIEVAAENQLDISSHQTRRVSTELVMSHDLILVMESEQQRAVEELVPVAKGKVMLFGKWQQELEIPDPYQRSREIYQIVFEQLCTNAMMWTRKLESC